MVDPTAPLAAPLRLLLAVPVGIVATVGMDTVMARLPEGTTPPRVAAGVLTERHPDDAPARLASVVHYVAGLLTGPLYVTLLLLAEATVGASLAVYLGTAAVLFVLMTGFFVGVVLPRPALDSSRRTAVGRAWAGAAAAYVLVLTPAVWLASQALFAL
jgi:hypothetical protein